MKVHSSLGTKRKHAPNRADTILHPSSNTLTASRSRVERVLVIDIGGRSVKILASGRMQSRSLLRHLERKRAHANRCDHPLLERAP